MDSLFDSCLFSYPLKMHSDSVLQRYIPANRTYPDPHKSLWIFSERIILKPSSKIRRRKDYPHSSHTSLTIYHENGSILVKLGMLDLKVSKLVYPGAALIKAGYQCSVSGMLTGIYHFLDFFF